MLFQLKPKQKIIIKHTKTSRLFKTTLGLFAYSGLLDPQHQGKDQDTVFTVSQKKPTFSRIFHLPTAAHTCRNLRMPQPLQRNAALYL